MSNGFHQADVAATSDFSLRPDVVPAELASLPLGLSAPTRGRRPISLLWAISVAGLILYGSLLPFQFDWSRFDLRHLAAVLTHGAAIGSSEDRLLNVLVYLPLGLCLAWSRVLHTRRLPVRVAIATLAALHVSLLAEALQGAIPGRVPSWVDVQLNALGAAIGAGFSGVIVSLTERVRRWWQRGWSRHPFTALASVFTLGLFIYHLVPFDFVTDADGLYRSFRSAQWNLFAVREPAFHEPPFAAMMTLMSDAAWFFALGYLSFVAARELGLPQSTAAGRAIREGTVLAVLIELVQLFTASHQSALAPAMLRVLALAFGVWCAVLVVRSGVSPLWRDTPRRALPGTLLAFLLLFQITAVILKQVHPMLTGVAFLTADAFHWLPLETLWRRPLPAAIAETMTLLVTFGAMAVVSALLLRRCGVRRVWAPVAILVLLVAGAVELLQACSLTRTADVTVPLVALTAVACLWRLEPLVRPRPAPPAA